MKKFFVAFLMSLLALFCALGAAACGENNTQTPSGGLPDIRPSGPGTGNEETGPEEHPWTPHQTVLEQEGKEPNCFHNGRREKWKCTLCNNYFFDEAATERDDPLTQDDEIIPGGHNFVDGSCTVCHAPLSTEGLQYREGSVNENDLSDTFEWWETISMQFSEVYGGSELASEKIVIDSSATNYVVSIGEGAFEGNETVTEIYIPDTVCYIGENAFKGCTSLQTVHLPDSVCTIGAGAFEGCSSLESINIPLGTKYLYQGVFEGCDSLKEVHWDAKACEDRWNAGVASNTAAFEGCGAISDFYIGAQVERIGSEYSYSRLFPVNAGLELNIHYLGDMAGWLKVAGNYLMNIKGSVTSLYFGDEPLAGNITIDEGVEYYDDIEIPAYAFYGCEGITGVEIGGDVTVIGQSAFEGCTGLKSVTLHEGLQGIESDAFAGCPLEGNLVIPDSVSYIGALAFASDEIYSTDTLQHLTIGSGLEHWGFHAFNAELESLRYRGTLAEFCAIVFPENRMFSTKSFYLGEEKEPVTNLVLPNEVTSVPAYAFQNFGGIVGVTVPDTVTAIGKDAFSYMPDLKRISLPGLESDGNGGNLYYAVCGWSGRGEDPNGEGIIDVTFTSGVIAEHAVSGDVNVTVGENVEEIAAGALQSVYGTLTFCNETVGNLADFSASSLTFKSTVRTVGDISSCANLQTLTIENGVQSIGSISDLPISALDVPDSVTQMGDVTNCENLSDVRLPAALDISGMTFANCPNYKGQLFGGHYYVKGNVLNGVKDITGFAVVPDGVVTIAGNAFEGANGLKYVYLPHSVTEIADDTLQTVTVFADGFNHAVQQLPNRYGYCEHCTEDGWIYMVEKGEVHLRGYIGLGGKVTVPDTVDGKPVTYLESPQSEGTLSFHTFLKREDITEITIVSEELFIAAQPFDDMKGLQTIVVAESVKQLHIGTYMAQGYGGKSVFTGCDALTEVKLAGGYDGYQYVSSRTPQVYEEITDGAALLAKLKALQTSPPESVTILANELVPQA